MELIVVLLVVAGIVLAIMWVVLPVIILRNMHAIQESIESFHRELIIRIDHLDIPRK